jgi:hypothetical protein
MYNGFYSKQLKRENQMSKITTQVAKVKPKLPKMVASQTRHPDGYLLTICKPAKCRGSKTFSTEYR